MVERVAIIILVGMIAAAISGMFAYSYAVEHYNYYFVTTIAIVIVASAIVIIIMHVLLGHYTNKESKKAV